MALSRTIVHLRFAAHHQATVKSPMRSRIRIERVLSDGEYNAATGVVEGATATPLYLGKANIEKIARPTRREFVSDAADNQTVEVQIPLDVADNELGLMPDYQSNDRVVVLANPDNPNIVGDSYYVHGDAGASIAWVQILVCRYSTKQGK